MSDTYQISYAKCPELPSLAWCAVVEPGSRRVEVFHGPAVECKDDFFVEGAWNGSFTEPCFGSSLLFMGSGACVAADGIIFSTASHTLEPLYYVRSGERLLFSNSLAFLLARSGLELDPRFPHYQSILSSSRFGIKRYTKQIPTADGTFVSMLLYCSTKVGTDGSLSHTPRPEPDDFTDFGDYKSFLISSLSALWANAKSADRSVKYGMTTPISSGYDSPACAVLAKEIGGNETFTFHTTSDGECDSGAPIAHLLGMQIQEFAREDSYANSQAVVEFVACCDAELHFGACEKILANKLCMTGFFADTLWSKELKPPWGESRNVSLERVGFAGTSLCEFRLRVGFIHVPIPMIGMSRDRSVWKISNSPEMAAWSLNKSYDRPIPRRLVEEAGVPRDLFGQSKKVTLTTFNPNNEFFRNSSLVEDYRAFVAKNNCRTQFRFSLHNRLARALYVARRAARALDKASLLPTRLRMPTYGAPPVPIRFMYPLGEGSYLIPWAVDRLCDQYRAALPGG